MFFFCWKKYFLSMFSFLQYADNEKTIFFGQDTEAKQKKKLFFCLIMKNKNVYI